MPKGWLETFLLKMDNVGQKLWNFSLFLAKNFSKIPQKFLPKVRQDESMEEESASSPMKSAQVGP